ncbi:MAG: DUF4167 domain-containing protein [Paracoccaceae bacterium]
MRSSQKSNRARGRGNRRPNGNNINRVFESAGPEGKVRGTPQQIIEKYLSLARDSQTSDNRVMAENYFQHAEHYQRLLAEAMGARQERRDAQQPDQQPGQDRHGGNEAEVDGEVAAAARSGGQRRDAAAAPARDPRESEVSGLTTIDSGQAESGSLLVDAEELSASQPRRRPRSRDRDQAQSPSPAEADASSE